MNPVVSNSANVQFDSLRLMSNNLLKLRFLNSENLVKLDSRLDCENFKGVNKVPFLAIFNDRFKFFYGYGFNKFHQVVLDYKELLVSLNKLITINLSKIESNDFNLTSENCQEFSDILDQMREFLALTEQANKVFENNGIKSINGTIFLNREFFNLIEDCYADLKEFEACYLYILGK